MMWLKYRPNQVILTKQATSGLTTGEGVVQVGGTGLTAGEGVGKVGGTRSTAVEGPEWRKSGGWILTCNRTTVGGIRCRVLCRCDDSD